MRRQELVRFQYEQTEHTMLESDYKQVLASITDFYCGFLLWFLLLLFLSFFFVSELCLILFIYFLKRALQEAETFI